MASKVVALLAVVAAARAQILRPAPGPLAYAARAPYAYGAQAPLTAASADPFYDPNPSYDFNYSVNDVVSGDSKTQTETRQGDVVRGSYSLVEADGSRRVVDYTADPVNGFNADVRKEPLGAAGLTPASPVPVAPVVAPTPLAASISRTAPLGYAARAYAPLAARSYAAPAVVSNSYASPYSSFAY